MTIDRPLVTTEWLAGSLGQPDLRILDASHHLPTAGRNARTEYDQQHIPGAVFFDIDEVADHDDPLPHMLPPAAQFARQMGELGIGDGDRVVIYDTIGTTGAARAWWTFRFFGVPNVAVLDGGLPKWLAEGRPVTKEIPSPTPRTLTVSPNPALVRNRQQILDNISAGREQVVDARSAGRFRGTEAEPRAGMRGGRIPNSLNVPFPKVLADDRTFRSPAEIRAAFEAAGVDLSRPIATTCGSGVTASTLALALHTAGIADVPVYDGSWSEWGSRQDTPIDKDA